MNGEQFVAAQAEIVEAPAPLWERWTIDEIDEDFARVLIARAGNTDELRDIAAEVMGARGSATPAAARRQMTALVRGAAMRAELTPVAQRWSDEVYGYAAIKQLQAFLRGRGGKPGLPTDRPLREGDVFWVMVAGWAGGAHEPPEDLPPGALATHMASLQSAAADVWDVTAAARQASKRSYHDVLRKTSEEPEDRPEQTRG